MRRLARPAGGISWGKGLLKPPYKEEINAGAPCRILFLTDLHLRRSAPEMMDAVAEAIADTRPDLILTGGDLAEYGDGLAIVYEKLASLFPGTPVFSVPGNNDDSAMDGDRSAQRELIERFGGRYLTNETAVITVRGIKIELRGVEDAYTHTPEAAHFTEKDAYHILLSHAPHRFLMESQPDLMLCGHTHGGQWNLLGCTAYTVGYESKFDYKLLAGHKRFGKTLLVVSRGVGYSKFPLRAFSRSEVQIIY